MLTDIERIERALARIRRGWCRDEPAKNKRQLSVHPCNPEACRWCLWGSFVFSKGEFAVIPTVVLVEIRKARLDGNIGDWNDAQRSKRPVIALLERALRAAKETAK